MNGGTTYVEVNYDQAWVENALANIQGFAWLYEWGMYIFLLLAAAILFWIFYDSITKKKDQKALVPRILSMVGLFSIIPAFIFRFTGNIDPMHQLKLNADPVHQFYGDGMGVIKCNAVWLCQGYGSIIAIITLVGVLCSIAAIVIYMSSVHRARPATEFARAVNDVNSKIDSLESKVEEAKRGTAAAVAGTAAAGTAAASRPSNATIIDRKPQAATIIDVPKTGDTLTVQAGGGRGTSYDLPANGITIGRDATCYIVVDDGKVSGKHVKLSYTPNGWSVMDLGSTNGTYVNNQRISGQVQLQNGDTVKIGDTVLAFAKAI